MNTLEILIAIWTAILTLVATYVVVKQYQLEKTKIKFEHFEKRYNVYKKVMDYIASIVSEATTSLKDIMIFRKETIDVMIFFGDEIKEYVDILYDKANRLRFLTDSISKGTLTQGAHTKFVDEEYELMTWFGDQFGICQDKFIKYLRVDIDIFNKSSKNNK